MRFLSRVSLLLVAIGAANMALAAPAKRVIALSPHSVEMLYAIGAGESILATTAHTDFPPAALSIPQIGGNNGILIERVLELNPDLVVVWGSGNKAEDITRLKSLGFKVFNSDPKSLDGVAADVKALGELTGHTDEANKVADDYLVELATLRRRNATKADVKVFYQLWSTPLMTVSKHSWIQQIIDVCHGDNVYVDAASDYPQVSVESVLLKMPEVILQSQDKGNILGVDWSQWQEIPAVNNKHIYQLNADLLHRATPRALLGVSALCEALDKAR
ncbi:cobalamin-binding protein [Shewanella sp. VB17]|uniref:cobalamin-binding protein n=1 Tax=Shewanella sp. VB17 TaxID=2739432 RepID=UPI00156503AF|nr:cobalamin-binding protein [Shewanella sp. VB17]NRD73026.1 cobalamin-binding protein [Shewanella sp. VB17]